MKTLIQCINSAVTARLGCVESNNNEWFERWEEYLVTIQENNLPRGSGFDAGTTINLNRSGRERIVLDVSYHHMDEHGGYSGWTEHSVIVYPTFDDFKLRITGRNKNDIKDYIHDVFSNVLAELYDAKP